MKGRRPGAWIRRARGGVTPPDPERGLAVSESRQHWPEAGWFAAFLGIAIFRPNLLGDGFRDVVDPRLRRSR